MPEEPKVDAAKVVHGTGCHKLSHLEDEFLEEWAKFFTGMQPTARRLLRWIAERV